MKEELNVEETMRSAIVLPDRRDTIITYLSYALEDVRIMDARAYQLLQLAIDALGDEPPSAH